MWGSRRFKLSLAGKRFTLLTDHKPLKYLKDAGHQNDHVFLWAVAVQEYSFRVEENLCVFVVAFLQNATIEYLSESLCVHPCARVCFCTITQKVIDLGT